MTDHVLVIRIKSRMELKIFGFHFLNQFSKFTYKGIWKFHISITFFQCTLVGRFVCLLLYFMQSFAVEHS